VAFSAFVLTYSGGTVELDSLPY